MKISRILVLLVTFLVVTPQIALAQYSYFNWNNIDIVKIIFGPNINSSWYQPYTALQYLVFPFIMVWMIIFGFLEELRIFRNQQKIEGVLALVMALIASSSGWLVEAVRWMATLMGGWSVLAFFALFMVGIFMYVGARFSEWGVLGRRGRYFDTARRAFDIEREIGENQTRMRDIQNAPPTPERDDALQYVLNKNQNLEKELQRVNRELLKEARKGGGGGGTFSLKVKGKMGR